MDKNKEECRSCGRRRDQHGDDKRASNYCPRFVASGVVAPKKEKSLWDNIAQELLDPRLDPPVLGGPKQWYQWNMRINRTAPYQRDPFEPVYSKAAMRCEKIDYTEWVDEEDCLTDTTRGGMRPPPPKGRIIF